MALRSYFVKMNSTLGSVVPLAMFLGIFPKPVDPAHLHGISFQNESSVETWQVKQTLQLEFMNLKRAKLEYFVSKDIIGYRFG